MKESFYFSHDYNSRQDVKIKSLLRKHGIVAYGIFWAIIEDLYLNGNKLPKDYELIAYDIRCDVNLVKSIINDFELFVIDGETFSSESIERRLIDRGKKSETAKNNALKRWGNPTKRVSDGNCEFYILRMFYNEESFIKCGIASDGISRRYSGKTREYDYVILYQKEVSVNEGLCLERSVSSSFKKYLPKIKFGGYLECYNIDDESEIINFVMQCECNGNAIKEIKGKEIKEKESKEPDQLFEKFWNLYDKKKGKDKTKLQWGKLKLEEREKAINGISFYQKYQPETKYRKDPERYLSNRVWEDEEIYKVKQLIPQQQQTPSVYKAKTFKGYED